MARLLEILASNIPALARYSKYSSKTDRVTWNDDNPADTWKERKSFHILFYCLNVAGWKPSQSFDSWAAAMGKSEITNIYLYGRVQQ